MPDTRLVQVRVPRAEAGAWRAAALREDRSIAALVRGAVREHLRTTQREEGDDDREAGGPAAQRVVALGDAISTAAKVRLNAPGR
jgi:hypothetical protein